MYRIYNNNFFLITCLFLLSTWLFFYTLGDANFYHIRNESRRAEIVREMLEKGNWIVPTLEGEITLTKPPLFYWMVALCSLKSGVNEYTARIPSAVAGIGTILFTFLLGSFLFNRTIGFWSALMLMVTNIFMDQSRSAEMESMLTFFITGSIYCFFKGYRESARAKIWFPLFFIMMGLGTITKGPFAITFPLIPIISYLCIYRDKKILKSSSFLFGILFFFIILLPWPLLILKTHPHFARVVLEETIGRVTTGFAHQEPFYFYFKNLGTALFPWIFFLPFSIAIVFSTRLAPIRRENTFLLLWFLGNLLFLSLSKSKREFYLLPVTPGFALLMGATWEAFWEWAKGKITYPTLTIQRACFGVGVLLVGISYVAGNPFASNIPGTHFPHASPFLFLIGSNLLLIAAIKRFFPSLSTPPLSLTTLVVLTLVHYYLYFTYTVPLRNAYDSGKHFYLQVSTLLKPSEPLAHLASNENYTFSFYAHRPVITLKEPDQMYQFMSPPEKRYLVVTERALKKAGSLPWKIKWRGEYSEHSSWGGYLLLFNQ